MVVIARGKSPTAGRCASARRTLRAASKWVIGNATPSSERTTSQAIVTVVERKSGYAVIAKVSNKTSDLVGAAIIKALKPFQARVKTLTYDNGKEFCGHANIDQALGSTGYFARPFASWERGSDENFNGLLGQYVPKKRQMTSITDEEIKMIENVWDSERLQRCFINQCPVLHFVLEFAHH